MSPNHASSVALVLNLATGHVTPQFHVTFDDDFSIVQYLRSGETADKVDEIILKKSQGIHN